MSAYLYGKYPKNSIAGKQVREFIKFGKDVGMKGSKAYKSTLKTLVNQSGKASAGAVEMGAVIGAGAVGAASIYLKGKKVKKDIQAIENDILKSSDATYRKVKAMKIGNKLKGKRRKYGV